ncbi:hypothetical protein WJ66_01415, partial [Stenotrophomonas maltophilia WJ66]
AYAWVPAEDSPL